MKKSSKTVTVLTSLIAMACFSLTAFGQSQGKASAQTRDRRVIMARAGGVNSVSGHVMWSRAGLEPQLLTAQDDLNAGDIVETGINSQVEVLLNPGSYFRLADESKFTLVDNSLDNLLVKLIKGSAIIEATGPDDVRFQINVEAGNQKLAIARSGIYRLNVSANSTELLVRKGRVILPNGELIKSGKKVSFAGGAPLVAKLEKTDVDAFDLWSKQRAEMLAQANRKLSNSVMNAYLSNGSWGYPFFGRTRWGLWTFSPFSQCYTFLPFFFGWSSPYGHYYGSYFGGSPYFPRNNWPSGSGGSGGGVIVRTPPSSGPSSGPSSSGSGGGNSSGRSNGGFGPSPSISTPTGSRPEPSRGAGDGGGAVRPVERVRVP